MCIRDRDKDTPTLSYASVGDTIQYTYKVTNSGNVSLQPPYAVADDKSTDEVCQQLPSPLLPGQFFTLSLIHISGKACRL